MTQLTKIVSGYILLTVPTIIYGGYFLLQVLDGQHNELQLTDFQKSMFRAGHGHAGLLILVSLLAQIFADYATLSNSLKWTARLSFPISAILVSAGFFASAIGQNVTTPNGLISILYVGVFVLIVGLILLGIGLIKK